MKYFGKKTCSLIGIDLGARAIKAVQLSQRRGKWELAAAVVVPRSINAAIDNNTAAGIRELLFRHGFLGNDIVLSAPTKQLAVDVLELPPRASGAPIDQIARAELARTAKWDNEPFELASWELPAPSRGAAGTTMMAVGLQHKHAEALLDPFEEEGLNVVALDAQCCALARACKIYDSADAITAVLDIGWNSSLINMVRDGVVIYQRLLSEAGLSLAHRTIANEFQLSEVEVDYVLEHVGVAGGADELMDVAQSRRIQELVRWHIDTIIAELEAAFHYATHRYAQTPLNNLLLVGGGSRIAGACEYLATKMSVNVKILKPAEIVECPANLLGRCNDGVLTTALGLAWHGAST